MTELVTDGGEPESTYEVNGHDFAVVKRFDHSDAELLQCRGCLQEEVLDDHQDLEMLETLSTTCHIEWLREPEGGFHGVALRNAWGFRGRELIGVRQGGKTGNGEVVDSVRVYDDDALRLAGLLDLSEWERTEQNDPELVTDGGSAGLTRDELAAALAARASQAADRWWSDRRARRDDPLWAEPIFWLRESRPPVRSLGHVLSHVLTEYEPGEWIDAVELLEWVHRHAESCWEQGRHPAESGYARAASVIRDETGLGYPDPDPVIVTDGGQPAFIPPDTDYVECYLCGRIITDLTRVEGLDISPDEDYYPEMVPVCANDNHRKAATDGGVETAPSPEPDQAWIVRASGSYHYDRTCTHLLDADSEPQPVELDHHPGYEADRCTDCWPGVEPERPHITGSLGQEMKRVTVRIPKTQLKDAKYLAEEGIYPSRSEVIRAGLREELAKYPELRDSNGGRPHGRR